MATATGFGGGAITAAETQAYAGLYGKAKAWQVEGRGDVVLIGNFADHAKLKVKRYSEVHDTRAVTVLPNGLVFTPNPNVCRN